MTAQAGSTGTDNWTEASVPSQTGRVAVVTGANSGIGFETARVLAVRGASVILAVRSLDKGQEAARRIGAIARSAEVTVQRLDLSSLESIRDAAEELRARHATIDLLINNAGVMFTPESTTADGFETQFGTNHLGHFALTGLLLDRLRAVPGSRVVTVSSLAHRNRSAAIHFDDLQLARGYSRAAAYQQSKLANLLFAYELQRRLTADASSTIAVAAHPGFSSTDLPRHMPVPRPLRGAAEWLNRMISQPAAMGALPTLRAATDPSTLGGQYFGPGGSRETVGHPVVVSSSSDSHDTVAQRRLWAVSEELTGVTFPV